MVYKFVDKNLKESGINDKIKQNQHPLDLAAHQLAKELHKRIIRNFKKRTVYSGSEDNIWGADLVDMQLITKFNKGFRFLLLLLIVLVNILGLFL